MVWAWEVSDRGTPGSATKHKFGAGVVSDRWTLLLEERQDPARVDQESAQLLGPDLEVAASLQETSFPRLHRQSVPWLECPYLSEIYPTSRASTRPLASTHLQLQVWLIDQDLRPARHHPFTLAMGRAPHRLSKWLHFRSGTGSKTTLTPCSSVSGPGVLSSSKFKLGRFGAP